jgi:hypothetical protein
MTRDQRWWSLVALATFVVLCAISFALVSQYADIAPADLGFFDLAVLGLATLRLVHLLTYDKIFQIVRDPFMDAKGGRLRKAERGWRRLMCEFLSCLWCTGMWSAVFAVTIYFLGQWGRYAVILFAVAGLGSLLQVISKSIANR